jgi:hypothetical protein
MEHDSGSESSNDVPAKGSKLREKLYECLSNVKAKGSFSTHHHATLFPNPGLYIKDLGTIPLPLSDHHAKAIAAISSLAPLGMKDQTVVDTAVRTTWELNSSAFKFQNPVWQPFFHQLVKEATEGLGVDADVSVEAQSYKLLLYKEGAVFNAHKDSEQVPEMFGSLIICLPSVHEGGDVHLTHRSEKRVFSTAKTSQYDLSALAWYSDVKHEIRPVTSGYRIVLTFNLVANSRGVRSANQLIEKRMRLHSLSQLWKEDFKHVEKFVYILEHQYAQSSLRLKNLKGQDRVVGDYLDNVCSTSGFCLFFAQIERTEVAEGRGDDDKGEGTTLDHVVTSDGLAVASSCSIELHEILQDDPFDRDADSEDEGEYTGSAEMPGKLRYHNTARRSCLVFRLVSNVLIGRHHCSEGKPVRPFRRERQFLFPRKL